MTGSNLPRLPSPAAAYDGKLPRRFLAVRRPNSGVVIFDPWIEGARFFGGPTTARFARIGTCLGWSKASRENTDPLIGETLELVEVTDGEGIYDLAHVARAPFVQKGVFNKRLDVTESLAAAGPAIRAAVFEGLLGGGTGVDGWKHAVIGDAKIAVEPTKGAWSIENANGPRRAHRNPWGLSFALGAVPNGVFVVRLLEAFFRREMPAALALAISDAIDAWGPTPKEVRP